jgi:hypothetical protein
MSGTFSKGRSKNWRETITTVSSSQGIERRPLSICSSLVLSVEIAGCTWVSTEASTWIFMP